MLAVKSVRTSIWAASCRSERVGRQVGSDRRSDRGHRSLYAQGAAKGGARFSRLEGAWWGDRTGFFLSTNGGSVGEDRSSSTTRAMKP